MTDSPELLKKQLKRERAARLEAERLLEDKADELYESLLQTQASRSLLHSALNSMTAGLLLTTQDQVISMSNDRMGQIYPSYASLFVEENDLTGKFSELLDHPQYQAVASGELDECSLEIELRGGQHIAVGVRQTRDGLIASTHRDITHRIRAEQERRELQLELAAAQRMEVIGRMSGMIAHDFNNIIASIKGYASFLSEDLRGEQRQSPFLQRILVSANQAEALIRHIHELGNERSRAPQRVSLIPVLDECLETTLVDLAGQVEVTFEPPDKPIWVIGGEIRLSRLFTNILINALGAMQNSEGCLSVTLEMVEGLDLMSPDSRDSEFPGEHLNRNLVGQEAFSIPVCRVSIHDNGKGIEADSMSRIFEMYFSTRDHEHSAGVGLASVADIAMDFGGSVKLTSEAGFGTRCDVVLPLAAALEKQASPAGPIQGLRDVLIIDDDEPVGLMLKETLSRDGIDSRYFQSGEAALEHLLDCPDAYRVVLCDQLMPDIKGSDILGKLRQAGVQVPFILCSAQVDAKDENFREQMGDDFISKPVESPELIQKIRRYL